jgi:dTDP-4-dehydrorhamnose reductase
MKPTILLTGKGGQLGGELGRLLPSIGNVTALERRALDLCSQEQIRQVLRDARPQLVVNAAAYTAVDAAENDEANALAVNAEGPRVLAFESKKLGATLVHFSTDYVFDGAKKIPYVETDATNPLNAYGRSKLAGELAIRDSGVTHLIFRTSWVYATHGRNFLRTILRLASEREELQVVADQVGAPTCAADLAEATTRILAALLAKASGSSFSEVSGTYHMTAAGETTWHGFAEAILEHATRAPQNLPWLSSITNGRSLIARRVVPISTDELRSATRRPVYSVLSNALLNETFGVTLPDWRAQLQKCFTPERTPAVLPATVSSR